MPTDQDLRAALHTLADTAPSSLTLRDAAAGAVPRHRDRWRIVASTSAVVVIAAVIAWFTHVTTGGEGNPSIAASTHTSSPVGTIGTTAAIAACNKGYGQAIEYGSITGILQATLASAADVDAWRASLGVTTPLAGVTDNDQVAVCAYSGGPFSMPDPPGLSGFTYTEITLVLLPDGSSTFVSSGRTSHYLTLPDLQDVSPSPTTSPSALGADVITHLAAPVTVTRTGSATIELGTAPARATRIDILLTCLTAGTFTTSDGANLTCSATRAGKDTMGWTLPLTPGQHATSIEADPHAQWRLTATYSAVERTSWGVNGQGQTYGVANSRGTPDLLAAIATNGKSGYVLSKDLPNGSPAGPSASPPSQRTLPVYESDGTTVIGESTTDSAAEASASQGPTSGP